MKLFKDIFGVEFKDFLEIARWGEMLVIVIVLVIGYNVGSWIGLIISGVILYWLGAINGGAVVDVPEYYPPQEWTKNKCYGKDCKFCKSYKKPTLWEMLSK